MRMKPGALHVLGRPSPTELHPSPVLLVLIRFLILLHYQITRCGRTRS